MNKFFLRFQFLMALSLILVISSCGDDDPQDTAGLATISAVVDGNVWQSSPDGPHSPVGAVGMVNTSLNINVQGYASDGSYIALNVVSTTAITESTYTSSTGFFQASYKDDFLSTDFYSSLLGSGTLTFTNISSNNVSGTFSFNGVNAAGGAVSVDNGSFDIDL